MVMLMVSGVHQFPVDPPGFDLLPPDEGHEFGERLRGLRLNTVQFLDAPHAGVEIGEQIEGVIPQDALAFFLW